MILVRAGSYGPVAIDGKGLTLAEEAAGTSVNMGVFEVRSLAASSDVVVRGLNTSHFVLDGNAGTVLLEAVTVGITLFCGSNSAGHALTVNACADVVVARAVLVGGGTSTLAYSGIAATDSELHMYDSYVQGGHALNLGTYTGGDGVSLAQTFLFASGCTFVGGCGSSGQLCSGGGEGGVALRSAGGPTPELLGTVLLGGQGQCAAEYPFCGGCSPDGAPSVGGCATVAGFARKYVTAASAASRGTTTIIYYDGEPGDLVFSVVALTGAPLFAPELAGTIVPAIPPLVFAHGAADGSGWLAINVPLPAVPSGVAVPVWAQGAAISAVGAAVLAAPDGAHDPVGASDWSSSPPKAADRLRAALARPAQALPTSCLSLKRMRMLDR